MTPFQAGALAGLIVGAALTLTVVFVVEWWERHRIERVELDEAWTRFQATDGLGSKHTYRRIL